MPAKDDSKVEDPVVKNAKTLVENIARYEFGAEWKDVIRDVNTSGMVTGINGVVTVKVSTYTALELLGEIAVAAFRFSADLTGLDSGETLVVGKPEGDWTIIRTWWFEINDADRVQDRSYPGGTPKGVKIRFFYSDTRKSHAIYRG